MKCGYTTYNVSEKPQHVSFMKTDPKWIDFLLPPLYDQFPIAFKKTNPEDVIN